MNLLDFFEYEFFQKALIASVLVAIGCGIIGQLVLSKRMMSLVGGIAHAAYGGLGMALYFALPAMFCSLTFSVVCALLIAWLSRRYEKRADAAISVVWAFGMSVGVLLSDLSPGSNSFIMSYLFGAILAVQDADLYFAAAADVVFVSFALVFVRQLESICIDERFAKVCGIKEGALFYALIVLSSVAVIISLRMVGLILIIALLSIPSYIASMFCLRLGAAMLLSSLLAFYFCVGGLLLSVCFDLSASACIILLACLHFALALLGKFIINLMREKAAN